MGINYKYLILYTGKWGGGNLEGRRQREKGKRKKEKGKRQKAEIRRQKAK